MARTAKTLENSFEELDEVVKKLEEEDIGLEDSFKLYNQGMKLLKNCSDSIDRIEKKIIVLNENGEENEL